MKTYSMKESEVDKKWLVIDATGVVLGRLAAKVAMILSGKNKPTYTPSQDCGDNVIIINTAQTNSTVFCRLGDAGSDPRCLYPARGCVA